MNNLIQLIQEADAASVQMEQARQNVETAKAAFEAAKAQVDEAKTNFDAVVARADDLGVPRAKLRKLIEERSAVLMASGLMGQATPSAPRVAKPPRPKRTKTEKEEVDEDDTATTSHREAHDSGANELSADLN